MHLTLPFEELSSSKTTRKKTYLKVSSYY